MSVTINETVVFDGIGIHSGKPVKMTVEPSKIHGITFEYKHKQIQLGVDVIGVNNIRSTTLTDGNITIQTPEHFLAACYALNITNIKVSLTDCELPILDGSAWPFIEQMKPKCRPLTLSENWFNVSSNITFSDGESHYSAQPSDSYIIDASIVYQDRWVNTMSFRHDHSLATFEADIARARTYGFSDEVAWLKENGLAKGGGLENALVVTDSGYLNKPRFETEMVRHKILDFIGDMSIMNHRLKGHFTIERPSHRGNIQFMKHLLTLK